MFIEHNDHFTVDGLAAFTMKGVTSYRNAFV